MQRRLHWYTAREDIRTEWSQRGGALTKTALRLSCSHQVNLIRHWFTTKKSRDRSFNVYCRCRNNRNLLEFNHPTYSQNNEHTHTSSECDVIASLYTLQFLIHSTFVPVVPFILPLNIFFHSWKLRQATVALATYANDYDFNADCDNYQIHRAYRTTKFFYSSFMSISPWHGFSLNGAERHGAMSLCLEPCPAWLRLRHFLSLCMV